MTTTELKQAIREVMSEDIDTMTIKEAQKFLQMGRNQIMDCIRYYGMPYSQIGAKYRFSKEKLKDWHQQQM